MGHPLFRSNSDTAALAHDTRQRVRCAAQPGQYARQPAVRALPRRPCNSSTWPTMSARAACERGWPNSCHWLTGKVAPTGCPPATQNHCGLNPAGELAEPSVFSAVTHVAHSGSDSTTSPLCQRVASCGAARARPSAVSSSCWRNSWRVAPGSSARSAPYSSISAGRLSRSPALDCE